MWRFITVLLLLLQSGVPVAASVVDGLLEAEASAHATHLESQEGEDCPSNHDHLFCQVVRSLTHVHTGLAGVEAYDFRALLAAPLQAHGSWMIPDAGSDAGSHGPRAPPLA